MKITELGINLFKKIEFKMTEEKKDNSGRHKNAWKPIELPPHLQKAREELERENAKKKENKNGQ